MSIFDPIIKAFEPQNVFDFKRDIFGVDSDFVLSKIGFAFFLDNAYRRSSFSTREQNLEISSILRQTRTFSAPRSCWL